MDYYILRVKAQPWKLHYVVPSDCFHSNHNARREDVNAVFFQPRKTAIKSQPSVFDIIWYYLVTVEKILFQI